MAIMTLTLIAAASPPDSRFAWKQNYYASEYFGANLIAKWSLQYKMFTEDFPQLLPIHKASYKNKSLPV